jgi:hypothetical protein
MSRLPMLLRRALAWLNAPTTTEPAASVAPDWADLPPYHPRSCS